ncbi:hypothetical protein BC829DRAFT_404013 [Chytridium lagenaria]|nr:hypothetical protein BC829DRAFT_404013 [Chytridium lagenaria]
MDDVDNWITTPQNDDPRFIFFRFGDVVEQVVWEYTEDYLHQLPVDKAINTERTQVGYEWTDEEGGERFVVDRVREEDIEKLLSFATLGYTRNYLTKLITKEPHKTLSRVIRVSSSQGIPGEPISWCVTHANFGIGLVATDTRYQRKGLAKRCIESLSLAHRQWFKEQGGFDSNQLPHGFVAGYNVASHSTFKSLGYERIEDKKFDWVAVMARPTTATRTTNG